MTMESENNMSDQTAKSAAPASEWPMDRASSVTDAVVRLERAIVKIGNQRLRPWDLTLSSYTALRVTANRPNLSLAQLSRRCYVRSQTMTRIVTGLEERGFLERVANPDSLRALSLQITAAGAAALAEMDTEVNKINDTITQVFDLDQIEALDRMLRTCAQMVEAEIDKPE